MKTMAEEANEALAMFLDGLTYAAIGRRMGVSKDTAQRRVWDGSRNRVRGIEDREEKERLLLEYYDERERRKRSSSSRDAAEDEKQTWERFRPRRAL